MSEPKQFCTFYLGDLYLGVDVLKVQEIIRYQSMTRVPLAPVMVQGLINLRGQIVTAVDLRKRLEMQDRDEDAELPTNVVVRTDDGAVSLLVDEIGDVVEVEDDCHERPPETIKQIAREMIQGIYKLKDNLLLVLDTEKALNLTEA